MVFELIELARKKDSWKINNNQSYAYDCSEAFFLLYPIDINTSAIIDALIANKLEDTYCYGEGRPSVSLFEKSIDINGKEYSLSLFNGFCLYHLLVEKSENYNKYNPSFNEYDLFIRVSCPQGLDLKDADALALSYLFELQSTFHLLLGFSGGRGEIEDYYVDEEELLKFKHDMFPLLYGKGIKELLEIYNTSKTTESLDFKILGYTKVIEYISPTIAKSKLVSDVMLKLTSNEVLTPTAQYIMDLEAIFMKNNTIISKDSELIKLSIFNTITFPEIWDKYPKYLRNSNYPPQKENITPEMSAEYLERLAEAIYCTRNEIAHAKANYQKKGKECKEKDKNEFCELLDYISVRCIRWFALQPEEKRVVL